MNRWLVIFLLVFLPLQLSWAATASYHSHEGGAAKHFGHNDHQPIGVDGKDASPDPAKYGGDADCAACHAGCAYVLADTVTISLSADASLNAADYQECLTSPPFECPERPQWRVLA